MDSRAISHPKELPWLHILMARGGKPNDRCMLVRPNFFHDDNDVQNFTEYELKGVSVPAYETGA